MNLNLNLLIKKEGIDTRNDIPRIDLYLKIAIRQCLHDKECGSNASTEETGLIS